MRLSILLLVMLILFGCATPPEPGTIVETVTVRVPVIEPCPATAPARQSYETSVLTAADSDFDKIKALLVERRQRQAVEEELRALLESCTTPLNPRND